MGTVKLDRVSGLKPILIKDSDLIAKGKSSFVEYEGILDTDPESALRVIRWNDNSIFNLITTFGSAMPLETCMRWDRSLPVMAKLQVQCPNAVKTYNTNMGGVDKMDSLLGFYRIFFRSRKWYLRIFFHMLDLSLINAWLLYIRDFEASESPGKHLSLYEFKASVSYALRNQDRPLARVGRPARVAQFEKLIVSRRTLPPRVVIEDQLGHFPISLKKRGRCRNSPCIASIVTYCIKCQVYLCISSGRYCYLEFHGIAYDLDSLPH